jgi:hypothetical protein
MHHFRASHFAARHFSANHLRGLLAATNAGGGKPIKRRRPEPQFAWVDERYTPEKELQHKKRRRYEMLLLRP